MHIRHKNLTDRIHLLVFNTQRELASTFLRFQEHYESPRFRGKYFSLNEFKAWYIKNSSSGKETGEFTYYEDWCGFNIPSYVLRPFYSGKFDPLSKKEGKLLKIFEDQPEPFYIIGIHKEPEKTGCPLKHELAHGFFSTEEDYREEVLAVLSKFDVQQAKDELHSEWGYHEKVIIDEVHAYSIASRSKLMPFGQLR